MKHEHEKHEQAEPKDKAVHSENEKKAESSEAKSEKTEKAEEKKAETEKAENQKAESDKKDEAKSSNKEEKSEEKPKTPEERIAELEAEVKDLKTQALYKAAETDNWRKNMLKQKDDAVAYANENLLRDLLDSLDNFDRTVEAAETATDVKSIADGVKMISKSLTSLLENKYNLVPFGKEGEDFDPELHEAIGSTEGDVDKEKLKQVYLKGYKLKDRVIRHAKVMVEKPKAEN